LAHYSDGDLRCQCCGEREEMLLALDHINGQGPRRPGAYSGGNAFYAWLEKQGYPAGLRVLCHTCNCAKARDRDCRMPPCGPEGLSGRGPVRRGRGTAGARCPAPNAGCL
jgi:hypothetical protein